MQHPDGRVVIFEIPSRPQGKPLHLDGAYLMRAGEGTGKLKTREDKTGQKGYAVGFESLVDFVHSSAPRNHMGESSSTRYARYLPYWA